MPALGNIRLHAGKDPQAVFQHQGVSLPAAFSRQVGIQLVELQGVEVLRQAQSGKASGLGFTEEPVGVGGGEGQSLCQLPMGVKIQFQRCFLFSIRNQARVDASTARAIHSRETARNSRSL